MYGKCYESMYEGSMIGAGINVFAVWNYIIIKARGGSVEINPRLLAFTLGGKEEDVISALDFLQQPDPDSRSKDEGGRRLVKEGQFQYRLVNWQRYQSIRNAEDKREYNRVKQAEYRAAAAAKKKPRSSAKQGGLDGKPASRSYKNLESASIAAEEAGNHETAENLNHAPLVATAETL